MALPLVEVAMILAEGAHADQVRKYTGEPYICHPSRVVALLGFFGGSSIEMQAAAWLHDVVEDCGVKIGAINERFGPFVASLVEELTKPNEPRSRQAMIIKACDLLDNLVNIAEVVPAAYMARNYLAKKAPQVLRISEALQATRPEIAEALVRTWWRNWSAVTE